MPWEFSFEQIVHFQADLDPFFDFKQEKKNTIVVKNL